MRMSSNFKKTIQERDETRVWRREKWVKDRRQERVNYDRSIHFNSFDHPIKLVTISFGISHTKLIAKRGSIDDLQDPKHLTELTVLFCRYLNMFASSSTSERTWLTGSSNCDAQLCTRETCQRRQTFEQLLQWLAAASEVSDDASQITAVVNTICTVPVSSLASLRLIHINNGIISVSTTNGPSLIDPAHRI